MNANKNNLHNMPTKNRMPGIPNKGTTWQEWSGGSVVKDDEAGRKVQPVGDNKSRQEAPASNWPYRR